jgi:hypothetical protein
MPEGALVLWFMLSYLVNSGTGYGLVYIIEICRGGISADVIWGVKIKKRGNLKEGEREI